MEQNSLARTQADRIPSACSDRLWNLLFPPLQGCYDEFAQLEHAKEYHYSAYCHANKTLHRWPSSEIRGSALLFLPLRTTQWMHASLISWPTGLVHSAVHHCPNSCLLASALFFLQMLLNVCSANNTMEWPDMQGKMMLHIQDKGSWWVGPYLWLGELIEKGVRKTAIDM